MIPIWYESENCNRITKITKMKNLALIFTALFLVVSCTQKQQVNNTKKMNIKQKKSYKIDSVSSKYDVNFSGGENFELAKFRLWIPQKIDILKALLVIVPGYNNDGRKQTQDSVWQDFAKRNRLGIIACYFKDYEKTDSIDPYSDASKGSADALLDAIEKLSEQTNKKELASLPLILWGHSAGGQFNYEFVCSKPKKVLAFTVNKGGFYRTSIAPGATRNVPGIFFFGENDLYYRVDLIKGIFSVNRRLKATWTLIEEKNTGHEIGLSKKMAIDYFEHIIPLRLSSNNQLIRPLSKPFYIGSWKTKKADTCSILKKYDTLTVWLPNSVFAQKWENLYK